MRRPYIALGLDYQGRQTPAKARKRLEAEDATGLCETQPGELAPAEELQVDRFSRGDASPGEVYAVVAIVALAACGALHIVLSAMNHAEALLLVAR